VSPRSGVVSRAAANARVARRLGVSPKTVRDHVSNIITKLESPTGRGPASGRETPAGAEPCRLPYPAHLVSRSASAIIGDHPTRVRTMSLIPPWLRPPRVRERLASYHLRSDVLDAAAAMASDQRFDIYVVRLESSLTDSETVLRMMDGRHARVMGLLVVTSERILFRSRRRTGPNFSVPLEEVLAIQAYTRRGTGTVRIITPYGSLTVDQILGRQGGCSPMTPE
jgi:hypothetical protein